MSSSAPAVLRTSYWDVAFYSLMVGFGETYITAFALAMGFSEQHSGLIATVPILIGACLQLLAPLGVRALCSQRLWIVSCTCLQSLSLLGLAGAGWAKFSGMAQLDTWFLLAVCAYWAAAMSAAPSWNSWIAAVIPSALHTRFFAFRTRIAQLFTLVGLTIAGLILHGLAGKQERLIVFTGLFALAGISRFVSSYFLLRHPEGPSLPKSSGLRLLLQRDGILWLKQKRTAVLIVFMLSTQFAVNISGPYFNAYMLEQLHLDYQHYMILIGTSFVTRILAGGWFQRLAHSLGSSTLTHLGALLVIPSPTLWLWSNSFPYLIFAQVYTGLAWGCHELGLTLMLIDKQDHIERARLLTITTLLNSSMMCIGSLIGFAMLHAKTLTQGDYHFIFVLSAAVRILPFCLLFWIGDSSLSERSLHVYKRLRRNTY